MSGASPAPAVDDQLSFSGAGPARGGPMQPTPSYYASITLPNAFVGAGVRETLHLPDCGLVDTPETRRLIASTIRRYKPRIVMAPYWEDRHSDHAAAGAMVRNSTLFCTLRKLELLRVHETQFSKTAEQYGLVPQGVNDYLYGLESRDRFFGSLIGCQHGEAFVADRPLRVNEFLRFLADTA